MGKPSQRLWRVINIAERVVASSTKDAAHATSGVTVVNVVGARPFYLCETPSALSSLFLIEKRKVVKVDSVNTPKLRLSVVAGAKACALVLAVGAVSYASQGLSLQNCVYAMLCFALCASISRGRPLGAMALNTAGLQTIGARPVSVEARCTKSAVTVRTMLGGIWIGSDARRSRLRRIGGSLSLSIASLRFAALYAHFQRPCRDRHWVSWGFLGHSQLIAHVAITATGCCA